MNVYPSPETVATVGHACAPSRSDKYVRKVGMHIIQNQFAMKARKLGMTKGAEGADLPMGLEESFVLYVAVIDSNAATEVLG